MAMCSSHLPRASLLHDDPQHLLAMITRRPRAPNWRDFVNSNNLPQAPPTSSKRPSDRRVSKTSDNLGFSHLTVTHRSRSEGNDISRLGVASSVLGENRAATLPHLKHQKKHKNRLHRTRSQYSIEQTDLPEKSQMTLSLAETKPQDLGLRNKRPVDARIYLDENMRRCEQWLAGVRASKPKGFSQEFIPEECPSSDQDSASGKGTQAAASTKSGNSTSLQTAATSSESDIDSASVSGKNAEHKSNKFKSGIPILEGHRKSRSSPSKAEPGKATRPREEQCAKVHQTARSETDNGIGGGNLPPKDSESSPPVCDVSEKSVEAKHGEGVQTPEDFSSGVSSPPTHNGTSGDDIDKDMTSKEKQVEGTQQNECNEKEGIGDGGRECTASQAHESHMTQGNGKQDCNVPGVE